MKMKQRLSLIYKAQKEILARNAEHMKQRYDSEKANPQNFSVGDIVYLRNTVIKPNEAAKLKTSYTGLYKIVAIVKDTNARLLDLTTNRCLARLQHLNRLRKSYAQTKQSDRITVADDGTVQLKPKPPPANIPATKVMESNKSITQQTLTPAVSTSLQSSQPFDSSTLTSGAQRDIQTDAHKHTDAQRNNNAHSTEAQTDEQPDSDKEYKATRISKRRKINGDIYYLVHWRKSPNLPPYKPSWEKADNCNAALLEHYLANYTTTGQRRKPKPKPKPRAQF
jgi:hypothetical protein